MAQDSNRLAGARELRIRSEINVTPLVDVCLVLLIIFMVVTPMLVDGVEVALPETTAPDRMPEGGRQLDVSIRQDGSVYVGKQWVPKGELQAALRVLHQEAPERSVVVRADQRLAYVEVRDVMRLVNRAGWTGAGVETRRRVDRPTE
jgi:biopolymer transport protein TolR